MAFDHVTVRVSDFAASRAFYEQALATLGVGRGYGGDGFAEWDDFSLILRADDQPVTRRLHIAFTAPDRERVDRFWQELTTVGYRSDGEPGPRPEYTPGYYGAFVLDPDGNSVEAVHETSRPIDGVVHHLWLRVADVEASRRFYETIAPTAGLAVKQHSVDHVQLIGDGMSFSCVAGEPTQNLHVAFTARDNAQVDELHRAGIAAGFRDNGVPGERPQYHAGYYGAFLLDPDGNNVEAVCHNRG